MRWLALLLILGLLSASCATTPTPPLAPDLPFGEFIDHVLDPLATTHAAELLQHEQTKLKAGQISPALASFIGSLLYPGAGTVVGSGLAAFNNSSNEQKSSQLDTLQYPLKKEVLSILTKRTKAEGNQYSVCLDGAERRYGVQDRKFVRLADGLGPCEVTILKTLTQGAKQ
jgi:hypothetical protein